MTQTRRDNHILRRNRCTNLYVVGLRAWTQTVMRRSEILAGTCSSVVYSLLFFSCLYAREPDSGLAHSVLLYNVTGEYYVAD
jgi:hypothetical protein